MAFVVKLLVSVAVLAWILHGMDLSSVARTFAEAAPGGLVASTLVLLGLTFLQAWRWGLVMRRLDVRLRWTRRAINCFIGQFFNQTLPSTIGGDAVRIWLLKREGMTLRVAANGVLTDRLAALFALLLLGLLGLPWLAAMDPHGGAAATVAAAGGLGVAGMLTILMLDRLPAPLARLPGVAAVATLSRDARTVMLDWRTGPLVVCAAIVLHLCVAVVVWLIARSLGVDVTVTACLVLVPLVMVVSAIPVSVAGWGVREGAMVAALGLVGVSTEQSFAISLLFGLGMVVVGLPGGVLWLRSRARHGRDGADAPV